MYKSDQCDSEAQKLIAKTSFLIFKTPKTQEPKKYIDKQFNLCIID